MATDVRKLYHRAMDAFGDHVHAVPGRPVGGADSLLGVGRPGAGQPRCGGEPVGRAAVRRRHDRGGRRPARRRPARQRPRRRLGRLCGGGDAAVDDPAAMDRTVHLSFGDFPGCEYAMQLLADLLVHGWDLARATGADERMDPELVDVCRAWFAGSPRRTGPPGRWRPGRRCRPVPTRRPSCWPTSVVPPADRAAGVGSGSAARCRRRVLDKGVPPEQPAADDRGRRRRPDLAQGLPGRRGGADIAVAARRLDSRPIARFAGTASRSIARSAAVSCR